MQLIPAHEYYQVLLHQLPQARRRITLMAMVVAEGEQMHQVLLACEAAARRGVKVRLVVDIFTRHWLARTQKMARWQVTRASFDRLAAAGGEVVYYGHLGLNPVAGRLHIKLAVIDDWAYSFGGVNLSDVSFDLFTDYMLATRDAVVADRLERLALLVADAPQADTAAALGAGAELLVDGGTPGVSLIYDRACRLAAASEQLYYVSQYGPNGRLAALVKATEASCYYNRVWQMLPPANALLVRDKLRYGLRNAYHRPGYLHAKFILAELRDGTKAVLSGSHNFSWDGVAYGTKEVALYSTSEALWQQLYDYLQAQIA